MEATLSDTPDSEQESNLAAGASSLSSEQPQSGGDNLSSGQKPPESCPTLEILKTLHAASLSRWTNRRDHEWKLNYAFWAALAGLIALLLTNHFGFSANPSLETIVWIAVFCLAVILLQLIYLIPIASRGIAEIEMQTEIELALRGIDAKVRKYVTKRYLGAGMKYRPEWEKKYGMWAPLGVTLLLLFVIFWLLLMHPTGSAESSQQNGRVNVNCQVPSAAASSSGDSWPSDDAPTTMVKGKHQVR